jgi:hypothetical protein
VPISAAAENNPVLGSALFYARLGWSVVPTHRAHRLPGAGGAATGQLSCTCSRGAACSSPGKHPAVPWEHWQRHRATEAEITAWFTGPYQGYGVGIVTGRVSGIFVVDIDEGPGKIGGDTLRDLQLIHDDLPDTVQARTGGGGRHLIFRHPGDRLIVTGKNVLGPGVDVRGDGGFVVAAPSAHQSGRLYLWDERAHPGTMEPAEAPGWLIDMARQDNPGSASRATPTGHGEIVRDAWGRVVDGRERYMVGVICGAIANLIRKSGRLPAPDAVFAEAWPAYERNARARGASLEADGRGETLMRQRIQHMLGRAAAGKWRIAEEIGQERREQAEESSAGQTEESTEFPATPFEAAKLARLKARRWLYAHFLIRRYLTVLGAPGGVGKTAYATTIALAVCLANALLEEAVHDPGPVWYYNCEDPEDEVLRRVWAAAQLHGINPAALEGKLYCDSGRDRPLVIATRDIRGGVIASPIVPLVVAEIKRRGIKLLIVDPFVRTHRLEENRNEQIDAAAALWALVADEADCAILLLHHFAKGGLAGEAAAFRGASALIDASRAAITLAAMTEDEAGKYGISPDKRRHYVRVDNAKLNLARPPDDAVWLELADVELPNGDHVQAVTRWHPPKLFDNLPPWTQVRVLEKLNQGPEPGEFFSAAQQAGDRWAGRVLMANASCTEQQAAAMLAVWLKSGLLEKFDYACRRQNYRRVGGVRVNQELLDRLRKQAEQGGPAVDDLGPHA